MIPMQPGGSDDPPIRAVPWEVVLVDPDPTSARVRRIAFARYGVPAVQVFHNAAEVTRTVHRSAQEQVALVVLTPDSDSTPVIAALRAAGHARILAISRTGQIAPILEAIGAGATGALINHPVTVRGPSVELT